MFFFSRFPLGLGVRFWALLADLTPSLDLLHHYAQPCGIGGDAGGKLQDWRVHWHRPKAAPSTAVSRKESSSAMGRRAILQYMPYGEPPLAPSCCNDAPSGNVYALLPICLSGRSRRTAL